MIVTSRISEKDFVNLTFYLLYRRFFIKFITVVGILMVLVGIMTMVVSPGLSVASQLIFAFVILIIVPFFTFYSAKRNYRFNKRISEAVEYHFNNHNLEINGESFQSHLTYEKLYKASKTKEWILLWQTPQIANAIPRRNFLPHEIQGLKEILDQHNVKNNL